MKIKFYDRFPLSAAALTLALVISGAIAHAQPGRQALAQTDQPKLAQPGQPNLGLQELPNLGQQITPLAPLGSRFVPMNPELVSDPSWLAGQAVTTVVSPDQTTLLVLTSGYNRVFYPNGANAGKMNLTDSTEYVFIYDISTHTPIKRQVVKVANTYNGIVFDPSGAAFYVAGGASDNIHIFTRNGVGLWAEQPGSALPLGHSAGLGLNVPQDVAQVPINTQVAVKPCAAGLAISSDGKTLVVANYYNDSITIFTGGLDHWSAGTHFDLRPGQSDPSLKGVPGGAYPFWVAIRGTGMTATAYVSSIRDREIVAVTLNGTPFARTRIKVKGQPGKMTLNRAQSLLYVVEDQTDTVDVIDTATNTILESIQVIASASILPPRLLQFTGANPNSVVLSPDEKQLYVTNGNLNCVSVIALGGTNSGDQVVGLIPTGWYPNSVSFSADRKDGKPLSVYVVNGKSPTGANAGNCYDSGTTPVTPTRPNCLAANQYNPQLIKAGLQIFPLPTTEQLAPLTAQVAVNNRFFSAANSRDAAVMASVRQGVKHVIYIIKENRTYDQILGDLEVGNGDPDLAEFGAAYSPNQHKLARTFVTLDNFYDSAEVSNDGWPWTTSARAPDVIQRQFPLAYAGRGLSLDSEGTNRNVNVAIPTLAGRMAANPFTPDDADLLPGQTNTAAPDGPNNEVNTGYLWDSALRAGLTVRNYGFFIDTTLYSTADHAIPPHRDPHSIGLTVAYPSSVSLAPFTDPYFRGFDNAFPDYYRFKEWEREFDANYSYGGLPALTLVRFMHDHTGNFDTAIDKVNVPELQQADNDYAVGLLVEKISKSRYANDTLIFIIEDDAQDGGDHVDSHRSAAFVAGAYVKQGAVVSSQYNTIDFVRTIEDVLGLPHMNLNDALATPMADVFNTTPSAWAFTAVPAPILYNTDLPLPRRDAGLIVPKPAHDAEYWARVTKGMDFSVEDRFDFAAYNRVLWTGLMGDKPYPAVSSGLDLRQNRQELLNRRRRPPTQNVTQAAKPAAN